MAQALHDGAVGRPGAFTAQDDPMLAVPECNAQVLAKPVQGLFLAPALTHHAAENEDFHRPQRPTAFRPRPRQRPRPRARDLARPDSGPTPTGQSHWGPTRGAALAVRP